MTGINIKTKAEIINNSTKNINYNKLKKSCQSINWPEILNTNDVNLATDLFDKKINEL